jgi:uncharacterized protein YjcR
MNHEIETPKLQFGMTRKEIADALRKSPVTIRQWLRDIGIDHSRSLTIQELNLFKQKYIDIVV